MCIRHDVDGYDLLTVEPPAASKIAEHPSVGGRMAGADLQRAAVSEHDANDAVMHNGRSSHVDDRNRHDGVVLNGVDEVAHA